MSKYQEALDRVLKFVPSNYIWSDFDVIGTLQELVDKETPMKPAMVMLFGEETPTCPTDGCGVGLNPSESIWHKSSYCGNCGQKIDWSDGE